MPRVSICSVPSILVGKVTSYGGGHIAPGARDVGRFAPIGKGTAKKLLKSLFGHERTPRPGYETKLCDDTYLGNSAGRLEVVRRASGEFRAPRRRTRR